MAGRAGRVDARLGWRPGIDPQLGGVPLVPVTTDGQAAGTLVRRGEGLALVRDRYDVWTVPDLMPETVWAGLADRVVVGSSTSISGVGADDGTLAWELTAADLPGLSQAPFGFVAAAFTDADTVALMVGGAVSTGPDAAGSTPTRTQWGVDADDGHVTWTRGPYPEGTWFRAVDGHLIATVQPGPGTDEGPRIVFFG